MAIDTTHSREPGNAAPHAPEIEQRVLGAILIDQAVPDGLETKDFFVPRHAEAYRAYLAVKSRGQPIEIGLVLTELRERDRLNTVGGSDFLCELLDVAVTSAHLTEHVRKLKTLTQRRELLAISNELRLRAMQPDADPAALAERATSRLRIVPAAPASKPSRPRIVTLGERLLQMQDLSDPIATGFPSIDSSTRGGMRVGKFAIIGGAPGAGKTTVLCAWANHMALRGAMVGILATDEPAIGLDDRFARTASPEVTTDALETDDDVRRACAELLDGTLSPNLLLVEGHEGWTIETFAEELHERAEGRSVVLMFDSLQTLAAHEVRGEMTMRERVTLCTQQLQRVAARRTLVVGTSELARGAYRTNDPTQRTEDLAAFKESGAIEYGVDLALVLRSEKSGSTAEHVDINVTVAKNRLRRGAGANEFRVRINRASGIIVELAPEPEEQTDQTKRGRAKRDDEIVATDLLAAAKKNRLKSKNALIAAAHVQRARGLAVIDWLVDTGRLVLVDGVFMVGEAGGAS